MNTPRKRTALQARASKSPAAPPAAAAGGARTAGHERPGGRTTLIAVVGISPAILTETVWALANPSDGTPRVVPDEVVAITTLRGEEQIKKHLLTPSPRFDGRTVWQSVKQDLLGPDALQDERLTLRISVIERSVPQTGGTEKLSDIQDRDQNLAAAEHILRVVRFHGAAEDRMVASLAGGRKTMGALLHAAFSHLARPQDRLTHILVSEPYETLYDAERNPLFFYPTQPDQRLTRLDGRTFEARQAKLELADVPFAPMRLRFPDIAKIPTRFRDLVQTYLETFRRDATKPATIELRHEPARVIVDGVAIELESERQLCVIRFLLEANQAQWLLKDQREAAEMFKAWHGCAYSEKEIRPAMREAVKRVYEERKSSPGEEWIRLASNDTIKRPLSAVRIALDAAAANWRVPKHDLRLPAFRLIGPS